MHLLQCGSFGRKVSLKRSSAVRAREKRATLLPLSWVETRSSEATTATVPSSSSVAVSSSLVMIERNPVFLETIRVVASDSNGTLSANANILFDLGSQKT